MSDRSNVGVRFVDLHAPAMRSGTYGVKVTQTVDIRGQGETFESELRLTVMGPKYRLSRGVVNSVFPVPDSCTALHLTLPHVVIADPSLPWQRSAERDVSKRRNEPWLAVLLFSSDEDVALQSIHPAKVFPVSTTFFPHQPSDYLETKDGDEPLAVIDVPVTLFTAVAPCLEELCLLTHVREITPEAREEKPMTAEVPAPGRYSVVVCNRLPTEGKFHTVFLVSLEGYSGALPRSRPGVNPSELMDAYTHVRLVVLYTWSFTSKDGNPTERAFAEAVEALSVEPLRVPDQCVELERGYVALPHRLRDGQRTFSWYRGPLHPNQTEVDNDLPASSADSLLRYNPYDSMFDVSLAVAWQLGRLLLLADRAAATALFRWQHGVVRQMALAYERDILATVVQGSEGTNSSAVRSHRPHDVVEIVRGMLERS